jgi:hypothetical protein
VQVQLTLGEVAALQAAVSCLGYAVDGDLHVVRDAYNDDEHGIRRGDLQDAARVMDRVEVQARPLRQQFLARTRRQAREVAALMLVRGPGDGRRRS